jgi:hypothetical protein
MGVSRSVGNVVAKHSFLLQLAKDWASFDNLGRKTKSAHLRGWAVVICTVDGCDRDVTGKYDRRLE